MFRLTSKTGRDQVAVKAGRFFLFPFVLRIC